MSATWSRVRLGDVLRPVARATVPTPGRFYRQLGVRLWGEGPYEREPLDGADTKYPRLFQVRAGDIVVNKIWARNGSVGVVQDDLARCYVSGEFPTYEPARNRLLPEWMRWIVKLRWFWEECDERSRGTSGKNRIRPEQFAGIEIPLPPLPEQRRLVAKVAALGERLNAAQRLRHDASAHLSSLLQSALASWLRFEAPRVPLGRLIDPATSISYGVLVPGPDVEGGVPFVRVQDLDVTRPPVAPAKSISQTVEARYARTRLQGGEILIGVVGSIGKVGIAPQTWAGANIARAVCRIAPGPLVDRDYVAFVLQSRECQDYFRESTRTLAQPTLNVGQLAEVPIPVPALPVQTALASRVRDLLSRMEAIEQQHAATSAALDAFMPSILHQAFTGEL